MQMAGTRVEPSCGESPSRADGARSARPRRRLAALALVALAAGCDGRSDGAGDPPSSSGLAVGLPAPLLASRIRAEDIRLEMTVNGRAIEGERVGERWRAELTVEPGTPISIGLAFSSDGIVLATATRDVGSPTGAVTVSFDLDDYIIRDDDRDGFSNIAEIDGGSDPFDGSVVPFTGGFDPSDTSAIAGFYNASLVSSSSGEVVDDVEVNVRADGLFIVYDYQDDATDNGDDCFVTSAPDAVERTGEDEYAFAPVFPVPSGSGVARVVNTVTSDPERPELGEFELQDLEFTDSEGNVRSWLRLFDTAQDPSTRTLCPA